MLESVYFYVLENIFYITGTLHHPVGDQSRKCAEKDVEINIIQNNHTFDSPRRLLVLSEYTKGYHSVQCWKLPMSYAHKLTTARKNLALL